MIPFGLQTRLWWREASLIERRLAVSALAMAMALVVVAVVPALSGRSNDGVHVGSEAGGTFEETAGEGGGPAGPDGVAGGAPGGADGAAGTTATGGTRGTSRSGSATGGTGGGGGGGGGPVTLRASDRGVTADTVKIGFVIINLAGVAEAGIVANLRDDTDKVIDALVADANARGGVHGRRIVPVKREVDILSLDDQNRKCTQFADEEKVFAVLDVGAFANATTRACLTKQKQTLLFTGQVGTAEEIREAAPYQTGTMKDDNRKMLDYVRSAQETGFFDPAKGFKKLGILWMNCRDSIINTPNGLKAYLRQAGVTSWSEYSMDCDLQSQQRAGPVAQLQFAGDGVTHVLPAVTTVAINSFLNSAQPQGYKPKYFLSDLLGVTLDSGSRDYNPDQFDGVMAYTTIHHGDPKAVAAGKRCNDVITKAPHNLPPITDYGRDLEALTLCDHLEQFLLAAGKAGPNPTRRSLGEAIGTSGEMRPSVVNYARFDRPGKLTGGDSLSPATWRRDCRCWRHVGPFRPAYG
ncbi:MAG TPA: ABC transporter substrate-binding protein [Acidimicrobiales bacterium]|nr:ABC transporter substrate-binding protein [Acidimicrobiales bacterium]